MLLASPGLHHETKVVRIEKEAFRVAGPRRSQVDQEHHGKLEALCRMNRQQGDGVRGGRVLCRLAHRKLRVDHLVQVPDEVADSGEREIALETPRQLKNLAQI